MQRAHQHAPAQAAQAEGCVGVAAVVLESMQLARYPTYHNAVCSDAGECTQLAVVQVRQVTQLVGVAHRF